MNNKIEHGIMALIIGASNCPENIGKIVHVIGVFKPASSLMINYVGRRKVWEIKGEKLHGKNPLGMLIVSDKGIIDEHHLMPIRPGDEQTEKSKTLELQD